MFDQTSGYCVQPSWYINKPSQHLCFRSQKLALCTDFRSWLRPGRKLGILWSLWLWEPSRDSRKFYFVGLHYITNDSLTEFKVGEHSARLCILPPNVQKQEGHERRAKSGWCARARGESHMCIQGSQRPTFFTAKSRLFQLTVSKKARGISGPWCSKQKSPARWLHVFVDHYELFWNIFSLSKVTVCPVLPKTMLKNNNTENVALGRVQGERAQWGKTTKGISIILATRKVFFF